MGNTFITPSVVAREAIIQLENSLVLGKRVHRDYSKEFAKVGDTVTIRKPATFTSKVWNGSSVDTQNVTEGSVAVKLDTVRDITFDITSLQKTLELKSLSEQVIQPAMRAHAQAIDEMLAALYYTIPYYQAVSGTPAASDIAGIDKILNGNKVPMAGRSAVLSHVTKAKYIVLDPFLHAEKRGGDTRALKEAEMGRVMGMEFFMDQNMVNHTKGTVSTADKITCTASSDTVNIEAVTDTCTVKKGDILETSDGQVFVFLEDSGDITAGNSKDLAHYPKVSADVSQETITTVHDTSGYNSLAFHKNAFALVMRPLEKPSGAPSEVVEYKGLSARVVSSYDMGAKSDKYSIDILCGVKTLTEELACRFID